MAASMDAGGSLKLQGDLNLSQTSLFPPASQPPGSMFGLGSQDGLPSLGALAAQIPGGSEPQNALAEHFAGDLQSQGLQLPSQSLGGASLLSVPPLQQADPMNLFTAMAHNLAVMSTAQLAQASLGFGLLGPAPDLSLGGLAQQPQPLMSLDVLHGKSSSVDGGQKHPSLNKPEHRNSKASRRGPMDDMRQLVRILVKIFPQSTQYLQMGEEGGGNRVSEPQIKEYLRRTLGSECPQPEWGLPQGWGEYIATLFSWGLGRPVSQDQAMKCARRQQGRSWEVVESEIGALGIYTYAWPMPLTLEGVRSVQLNPPQPPRNSGFAGPWAKAMAEAAAAAKRPAPGTPVDTAVEEQRKVKRACTTGPTSPVAIPAPAPAPVSMSVAPAMPAPAMSAPLLPRVDEAAVRSASRYSLLGLLEEMLKYADEFIKFGQATIYSAHRNTQPDTALAPEIASVMQQVQQRVASMNNVYSQVVPAVAPHAQQTPPPTPVPAASSMPVVRPAPQLPPVSTRTAPGAHDQAAASLLQAPMHAQADLAATCPASGMPSTCSYSSEEDEPRTGPHARAQHMETATTTAGPATAGVKDDPSAAVKAEDSQPTGSQRARVEEMRNQLFGLIDSQGMAVSPACAPPAPTASNSQPAQRLEIRDNIMAMLGTDPSMLASALVALQQVPAFSFQGAGQAKAEAGQAKAEAK